MSSRSSRESPNSSNLSSARLCSWSAQAATSSCVRYGSRRSKAYSAMERSLSVHARLHACLRPARASSSGGVPSRCWARSNAARYRCMPSTASPDAHAAAARRRYSADEFACSSLWLGELFASFSNMDPTSFVVGKRPCRKHDLPMVWSHFTEEGGEAKGAPQKPQNVRKSKAPFRSTIPRVAQTLSRREASAASRRCADQCGSAERPHAGAPTHPARFARSSSRYQSSTSHPRARAVRESGRSGETAWACSAAASTARSEWWSP